MFIFLLSFILCTPSSIDEVENGCKTGKEGSYIVAVFNSDVSDSVSKNTCNLQSAVYEYSNKTQTYNPSSELLKLRVDSEKYHNNYRYFNTDKTLNNKSHRTNPDDYGIGEVYNIRGTDYVLKQKRPHCFVWLRKSDDDGDYGQGGDIEDTDSDGDGVSLEDYADYFNNHSWSDITNNFVSTEGWDWGSYPEGVVHILFSDMGSSPAGYFSPSDLNAGLNSIHINTIVAQNGTTNNYNEPNPVFTEGTLTHEFQHLAHSQVGAYFSIWLNEFLSCSAETVWSGQAGIYIDFYNERSEYFNEVSLINWSSPDHRDRYAIASIFGIWIAYQTRNGDDKGVFFRKLYENKGFHTNDLYIFIKTATDVDLYTADIDFTDELSVKSAWTKIYGDFLGAMVFDDDSGIYSFNGAWEELNPTDPDSADTPVRPEVHYYAPDSFKLYPSAFAFIKADKEIIESDDFITYNVYKSNE